MNTSLSTTRLPMRARIGDPWPRLFDWLDALTPGELTWRSDYAHALRLEHIEKDDSIMLRLEIPGVDPDRDIDITLDDGVLTVSARREERHEDAKHSEFYYGQLQRSMTLPPGIETEDISAEYRNGILEISIRMPAERPEGESVTHIPIAVKKP